MTDFSDNPMNSCYEVAHMAFKSVLDPAFKYRTAVCTNLRETFERVRREQQLVQQGAAWEGQERRLKVVPIHHSDRRRKMLMRQQADD